MNRYTVYIVPDEFKALKSLPGNVRHRIRRAIDGLADNPRPSQARQLDVSEIGGLPCEVWRLRLDLWRIVYLITESEHTVDVVAVRKRPPYDYGDLTELLSGQS